MDTKKSVNRRKTNTNYLIDSKKLLLDAHLTEFSRLREEIVFFHSQKSNAVNFAFLALAGMITVIPNLLSNFGDYILLVSTLPFFGIIWYVLSMDNTISYLSHYLKNNLIPNVNNLLYDRQLLELGIPENSTKVLNWELLITRRTTNVRSTLADIIFGGGRTIIIFGPILVLIGTFILQTKIMNPRNWTSIENDLLWANSIGLIIFAILGLVIRSNFGK